MDLLNSLLNCKNAGDCLRLLTLLIIIILINMVVLRWMWNNALVPHVSILKPITTLMDAFILAVGISVLRSTQ